MSHKATLKLLFPLELGGIFDDDITLEGATLDDAQTSAAQLLYEMFPQSCTDSITDWERVYGLTPNDGDTLQTRQLRVIAKMRELGELSLPYFASLATSMGYTCTIEELLANTDGLGAEGIFRWRITFTGTPITYFRVGQSRVGDRLVDYPILTALEGLFTDLKPAHTQVIFAYA
jgi:uncharacterized protein YmfQ (DUF2313 family)